MARGAVLVACLLLFATPAAGAGKPLITPAQTGKTIHLAKGKTATLRLSHRWSWTEPRVSSKAVDLTSVSFFVDPGYSEWVVTARRKGTATIRATGAPVCAHCGLAAKTLRVTIVVP
jgi:predicted secreted protein